MRQSAKSVAKIVAILVFAVTIAGALSWLRTYYGHEEWARKLWKVIWFGIVPMLILAGGWLLKQKRNAGRDSGN